MKQKKMVLGILLGAALPCAVLAASGAGKLPDWSGSWSRAEGLEHPDPTKVLPYLKDEEAAAFAKAIKEQSFRVPWSFCDPPAFPAMMTEVPLPFEFLFTRGRVTLLMADNEVRRIYTDGRPHVEDPDPGYFGDSTGKWEGSTLVVDTVGLRDDNDIVIGLEAGAENMHVVERIKLLDANTLSDDIEISALPMLKQPFRRTQLYKRDAKTPVTENICVASKNRNTGSSVDLTPPPAPSKGGN